MENMVQDMLKNITRYLRINAYYANTGNTDHERFDFCKSVMKRADFIEFNWISFGDSILFYFQIHILSRLYKLLILVYSNSVLLDCDNRKVHPNYGQLIKNKEIAK